MDGTITLGVPKGRIMKDAAKLFASIGIDIAIGKEQDRAVMVTTSEKDLRLCLVRSKDLPMLLDLGVVDIAIAGTDTILEADTLCLEAGRNLDICKCRLSLIGCQGMVVDAKSNPHPRVATKYPKVARQYFEQRGMSPEIIKMNGSVEIAPLTGIAPFVVDIVDTGETITRNSLIELEVIAKVSAHAFLSHHTLGIRRRRCNSLLDQMIPKETLSQSQLTTDAVNTVFN